MDRRDVVALAVIATACSSHANHASPPATPPDAAPIIEPPGPAAHEPAPPTLRLPDSFRPTAYTAHLKIDPAQPRFDGEIAIAAHLAAPSPVVWLDAEELTIDTAEAQVAGATVPLTATPTGKHFVALRAPHPLAAADVTLRLRYHGALSDQEERGAWRRSWHGDWYVFTQFEAIAARRVFPCVDEPGSKVPWTLSIDAPATDVALGNAPGRSSAIDHDWNRWDFAPTRPLPAYLVAFAVGPFELVDAGHTASGKPIRIAAPKGRAAEAAYAAKVTAPVTDLLEKWFGLPYPYDKLDEVVAARTGGAMENAGLITYNEPRILIDPADPSDGPRHAYASVAAHEIAHHWFGDLVTTAWWDDLWLNEAFATWMQDKILVDLEPAWHADLSEVERLATALGADDLGSARMIRQPIASEDDIYNAFDGITYLKGASVIRMFERWVGPAKFQQGVHDYLVAHADGNATARDFLGAIGKAAGVDVTTPFETFLEQAGAPRITATVACAKGEPAKVALHQERYLPVGATASGPAPVWQVPVCVAYDGGDGKTARACTLVTAADATMTLAAGACPTWLYANASASGYYRVGMTAPALAALVGKGWAALDDGERLELAADVAAMIDHGDADVAVALDLVPKLLAEKRAALIEAAARLGARVEPYVPAAQRAAYQAWIRRTYGPLAKKLGWTARKGDDAEVERARVAIVPLVAIVGGDAALRRQAAGLAKTWTTLPSATQKVIVAAAVEDPRAFDALLAGVKTTTDRRALRDLLAALAGVRAPDRLAKVLELSLDPALDWTQAAPLPRLTADDPAAIAAGVAFAQDHLAELEARVPEYARAGFATALTRGCDASTRDAAAAKAETLRGFPGGPRAVSQAIERMDQCIAQKALHGPELAHYFARR